MPSGRGRASGRETGAASASVPAPRRGRPRSPDADRRILDAVLDRLVRGGYARLRMDDVAADAGVAKTTVYRRWPTKPALVAEAVRTLYLDRIDPVDTGDLRSDLVALGCGFHELLYEGPGRVLEDLVRESGMTRELAGVVATTTDARRRAYRAVLDRAVERGELDPGVPHELVIDMLVGPLWTRLLITDTPMTASDVEAAVGAVLDGIRRPPSLGT